MDVRNVAEPKLRIGVAKPDLDRDAAGLAHDAQRELVRRVIADIDRATSGERSILAKDVHGPSLVHAGEMHLDDVLPVEHDEAVLVSDGLPHEVLGEWTEFGMPAGMKDERGALVFQLQERGGDEARPQRRAEAIESLRPGQPSDVPARLGPLLQSVDAGRGEGERRQEAVEIVDPPPADDGEGAGNVPLERGQDVEDAGFETDGGGVVGEADEGPVEIEKERIGARIEKRWNSHEIT